jgi:glycosyltransferase involved in cell wall biosynthesis
MDARLIYANTVRAALYAAPAARLARLPFVWHMRDFWLSENQPRTLWPDAALKRLLLAQARLVIANSRAVARRLPLSHKLHVVHNGIDIARFDPQSSSELRRNHAIPADAPVVGMIGRLRPWKGQQAFIEMAARVHRQRPDAYFVIVGGTVFGSSEVYVTQLHALAAKHQLEARVIFTGHLDDVAGALAAFDLFVHPGQPEPFGLVNIEAMAMCKPVVAFAHGALPEIVVDGVTGQLVPPGDVDALAASVTTLLAAPAQRKALGRAGRLRVEQQFAIERVAAEIDALLSEYIFKRDDR